jgi:AcrR family transcriptional regulator
MTTRSSGASREHDSGPARRRYDSPLRRQQAADTRERILGAGSALVHGYPTWDWHELTFRAVAEEAGVSERTVYRHFGTEQELHRAVMRRLEEEAGITYEGLTMDELAAVAARVFASVSSFAVARRVEPPPFVEEDRRRRAALLAAIDPPTGDWSGTEREMAAGILDVLWAVPAYERLTTSWGLAPPRAMAALGWAIDLVVEAIRADRRPPEPDPTTSATVRRNRGR